MNDAIVSKSPVTGNSQTVPICQPSGVAAAYTFLRHIGFILDELSAQGMVIWLGDNDRWQWRWKGTDLKSTQSFWAIGEAFVDAVIGHFPETFSMPLTIDEPE